MRRRKALFMGLILLNAGMYVMSVVPQVADSLQQRSGCREDVNGCLYPPIVFSELFLVFAGAMTTGILMLDRGFKHEDRKTQDESLRVHQ